VATKGKRTAWAHHGNLAGASQVDCLDPRLLLSGNVRLGACEGKLTLRNARRRANQRKVSIVYRLVSTTTDVG
jgi:hypothetical protein